MKLLSSNTKLDKGNKYLVAGLSLAPAKQSGHNVCPHSGGCEDVCVLWFAGRTVTKGVRAAAIRRTNLLFDNRREFLDQLHSDLDAIQRKAERDGVEALVRLNTASDMAWEKIDKSIFTDHPKLRFYDYTKSPKRALNYVESSTINPWVDRYHLTYSVNEKTPSGLISRILSQGGNVAMVFDTIYRPQHGRIDPLPVTWKIDGVKAEVVDGDTTDYRLPWIDGRGVIVGLRGKGGSNRVKQGVESGFIQATIGGITAN